MNIAFFDFDGTITNNDNYTRFIKYSVQSRIRFVVYVMLLFPVRCLYKTRILSSSITRKIVSFVVFRSQDMASLEMLGQQYSQEVIPNHVRKEVLERMAWHKKRGDTVVVVSASLDVYLRPWCQKVDVDLICTTLEVKNGVATGKYCFGDCSGMQKAKRIRERYNIAEWSTVYAYGDTAEDLAMLSLAHVRYFRGREVTDFESFAKEAHVHRNVAE